MVLRQTLILIAISIVSILFGASWNGIIEPKILETLLGVTLGLLFLGVGIQLSQTTIPRKLSHSTTIGIVVIPFTVIVSSMIVAGVGSIFSSLTFYESAVAVSGYGFYSASAGVVAAEGLPELALITFITNASWELFALGLIPSISKYLGSNSAVAASGAPAMDITLPSLIKSNTPKIIHVAFLSGLTLTIAAPLITGFWVQFI